LHDFAKGKVLKNVHAFQRHHGWGQGAFKKTSFKLSIQVFQIFHYHG